jgi:endonuclease-8
MLGVVELLPTREEHRVLGHLGPDVLGPDWDPEEVVRRLGLRPERTIGDALLDQRAMAGPGNVYRSEICFLRGVDPWTPVKDVRDLFGVVALTKRLMEANRTTGTQVTTGDTRPGRSRWVYGRGRRPCLRCGSPIRRGELGDPGEERVVYWCPSCQA